jgi:hypothetical protein
LSLCSTATAVLGQVSIAQLGAELAIPAHLQDGDESRTPVSQLIEYGARLFTAIFTIQQNGNPKRWSSAGESSGDER